MPTFSLTKTYLDCQTENGETIVCYASLLSLGHLKFRHASWLELLPDGTSKRRQTFIRGAAQQGQARHIADLRAEPQHGTHAERHIADHQQKRRYRCQHGTLPRLPGILAQLQNEQRRKRAHMSHRRTGNESRTGFPAGLGRSGFLGGTSEKRKHAPDGSAS